MVSARRFTLGLFAVGIFWAMLNGLAPVSTWLAAFGLPATAAIYLALFLLVAPLSAAAVWVARRV